MIANPVWWEPETVLEDWAIALTASGSAHFLGIRNGGRNGRLSTEIAEFDLQGDDRHDAERPPLRIARTAARLHGIVLWTMLRGRSGEPMPDFNSAEELELALRPAANAMKS